MALSISELKAELSAWATKVEGEAKTAFSSLVSWAEGEESKINAAIALLQGQGYTVAPPPPKV